MKLSFFGAAGEVTGSSSLLEDGEHKILVDCGMFQGSHFNDEKNQDPLPYDATTITAVVVTHAHLDHVGRLPMVARGGYAGHFFATPATIELAKIVMEDAWHIMKENHRKYGTPILYDMEDVAVVVQMFHAVDYGNTFVIPAFDRRSLGEGGSGIQGSGKTEASLTFHDAGHIFGSSFIEINVGGKTIVFSGDVGNVNLPIVRDTDSLPPNVDVLICESTYGNRVHESAHGHREIFEKVLLESVRAGGVIMIPAFSLERTQELLYDMHEMIEIKKTMPRVPIFLDSPMAIHAIPTYKKYTQYYDVEATKLLREGRDFFEFPGLTLTETRDQSKQINSVPGTKIIIAGSGMMTGGRIQHHAMRYLPDKNSTLLIVGYQARGTVGRQILEGASEVNIFGERIPVRCQVRPIGALSAHADQIKLANWAKSSGHFPKKIFLNHGEPDAAGALAEKLRAMGADAAVAVVGTVEI
ncbi:MAG: MBL fold metallo-hydrolase [bacterium]|nr:MBL fold metallo-hydrolase [bacterium]